MKNIDIKRRPNRAILNSFYNGDPPLTEQEAKDQGVLINYNDKRGAQLLHTARNQYENAFGKTANFFKVTIDCPASKQKTYSAEATRLINKPLKDSMPFYYCNDNRWGGVVLHGLGAWTWWDEEDPMPRFTAIDDLLIPTGTDLDCNNLRYIAISREMKPGALFRKTLAKKALKQPIDPGWAMDKVEKVLKELKDTNSGAFTFDWANQPEKMVEIWKQNTAYYESDKVPVIKMWDFFYLEEEDTDPMKNGWYRKILLDQDCVTAKSTAEPAQFLYEGKSRFCQHLNEFIHFQFGDGNNVPPFKIHAIRSLGWLLYDLVWILNRVGCQFTQHVFEQMMLLFRVQDPSDRSKLEKVILQGLFGVLPNELNFVKADERYSVDANLVQGLAANLKQSIGEASSQYTQQVDTGTAKERTAYEVQAVLAQASALMASMLGRAYRQQHFGYMEVARRFLLAKTKNKMALDFQMGFKQSIPEKYLDRKRWDIEVEQVLGGGNRTLEIAESTELMNRVNLFDPNAQQEIKHDWVLAITNNAKKASRLAPLDAAGKVTDAVDYAQQSFGSLMAGASMRPKDGVNHIEIIETLLGMMAQVIGNINNTPEKMGEPQQIIGLGKVAEYISAHIAILAQDPNEKARVAEYNNALKELTNEVKAFAERQAEAAAAKQNQPDPEVMANIQAKMAELELKVQAQQMQLMQKEQKSRQALRHKEESFQQKQRHKEAEAAVDIAVKTGTAMADAHAKGIRAGGQKKKENNGNGSS